MTSMNIRGIHPTYMRVMSISFLFGCLFWLIDGFIEFLYFRDNLHFLIVEGPQTYLESIMLRVSPHGLFVRFSFIVGSLLGGLLVSMFIMKRRHAEEALRESEEKYRTLLENAGEAVFVVQDNVIKFANPAMEELMGYSQKELSVTPFGELLHPEDRDSVLDRGERRLRGERLQSTYSWRVIRRNGEETWIQVITTVLVAWEGKPAVLCFMRDISEQKSLETRLQLELERRQKATEELLVYQKRLRDLTSQLAITEEQERRKIATYLHDNIGPSLAMAKWRLEALMGLAGTGDLKDAIAGVLDLMKSTIEDARRFTFEISLPILHELGIEAALEWLAENLLKPRGISYEIFTGRAEKSLNKDTRILLFHALRELVLNIVKHARATNARIVLGEDGNMFVASVMDNGNGFDVLSWRTDFSTSQRFGLFNVQERVDSIGGTVGIQSGPGEGTRVTLRVPLRGGA